MKNLLLAIAAAAMTLSACADPSSNKPKAEVSAPAVTAVSKDSVAAEVLSSYSPKGSVYNVSPDNSKISFTGSKVTGSHEGGFKEFNGIIDLIDNKAESSKVLIEIDMSSVFTDADGLTQHLQTGDFFDVAKFPKASFVSTNIAGPPGGNGNYTVTGDLIMRGVKKTITFPASIAVKPDGVTAIAEFSINRKDFGIVYAGKADDLIRDNVVLRLDLKPGPKK